MIESSSDVRVGLVAELRRANALAEYRRWSGMLEYLDAETARIERELEPRARELEIAAVRSVIAQANGWSEHQLAARLHEAETARDDLPAVWAAFGDGELDAARVSIIAAGAWKLEPVKVFV
ncbi:DUF222 domain-containing protein [Aeromicrobium phragmitis]|uniref:DUF222 domain-containing protein n=1 Tax=Aeromicrobium phragmitis TaxID=2478914 RepID=A0A3L8PKK8_9ACTN|nr:DUF222 domain-containing protein [Aeromicrobium phragmitis]RLV55128.1 DUF222 domain-containing protein [Aeromicrobium phragmitis]